MTITITPTISTTNVVAQVGETLVVGIVGQAGTGVDGSSFLAGEGVPLVSLGSNGDSYLNLDNGDVYKKTGGAWNSPVGNIRGPQGSQGAQGNQGPTGDQGPPGSQIFSAPGTPVPALGLDGDFYLNQTNGDYYLRAAGSWGAARGNLRGPAGPTGGDGVGISSLTVNGSGHLIVTKTDTTTVDAGYVVGPAGPASSVVKVANKSPDGTGNVSLIASDVGAVATSALGAVSGVATLGSDGKLTASQVPAIAVTSTYTVASQAAMLALTAEEGDVAIRTDTLGVNYILTASPASTLANWKQLTAAVPASTDNLTEGGTNLYFTVARVLATAIAGLSTATNAAITASDTVLGALGKLQAQITAFVATNWTWTKAQRGQYATLTDAATIAVDLSLANFYRVTLGGNRLFGEPTNAVEGHSFQIDAYQDGTGSRVPTWDWCYQFPGGTAPTPSTGKYDLDVLPGVVNVSKSSAVTISIATPGVVTWTGHGLQGAQRVRLTTTGALPTGLAAATTYYVIPVDANTFRLATSKANAQAGTAIATSGTQSGTHTMRALTVTVGIAKGVA